MQRGRVKPQKEREKGTFGLGQWNAETLLPTLAFSASQRPLRTLRTSLQQRELIDPLSRIRSQPGDHGTLDASTQDPFR